MTTEYLHRFCVLMLDTNHPSAWFDLCAFVRPGEQDSGNVNIHIGVTIENYDALISALHADPQVLMYTEDDYK